MVKDPFKMVLLLVGSILFTGGVIVAVRDAFLDYHMGAWGVLGSVVAGVGFLLLAVRRVV